MGRYGADVCDVFLSDGDHIGPYGRCSAFCIYWHRGVLSLLAPGELKSSLIVPIVGIMLGAVVSSISTFFALQTNMLQALGVWFAGSFTAIYKGQYEYLWLVVVVVAIVFVVADRLTVAGLGKDFATNVGMNYERVLLLGTWPYCSGHRVSHCGSSEICPF